MIVGLRLLYCPLYLRIVKAIMWTEKQSWKQQVNIKAISSPHTPINIKYQEKIRENIETKLRQISEHRTAW